MTDDRRTHLAAAENTALCVRASGDTRPDSSAKVWGHWLVLDPDEVDCTDCIEWVHA